MEFNARDSFYNFPSIDRFEISFLFGRMTKSRKRKKY